MAAISLTELLEGLNLPYTPEAQQIWDAHAHGLLQYSTLDGPSHDACVLKILKALESTELDQAGPDQLQKWERGWGEHLTALESADSPREVLIPKYFKHSLLRYRRTFIQTEGTQFHKTLHAIVRDIILSHFLGKFKRVVEFGCGTGVNLLALATMHPQLQLVGCDWTTASQQLLARLQETGYPQLQGMNFNMYSPPPGIPVDAETGVFTLHAMEQLGANYGTFLQYLLEKRPGVCLHLEPIAELYDEENLIDWLGKKYHHRRGYLDGYLTRLRALESQGQVELLHTARLPFGSFFQEGYSLIVWRTR